MANWIKIKRENVMIGQDEYYFNKVTSNDVNLFGLIMNSARKPFFSGDKRGHRSELTVNQTALPKIGQRIRLSKGSILHN